MTFRTFISRTSVALVAAALLSTPFSAGAQASQAELIAQLQEQIEALQAQIEALQDEVRELRNDLDQGSSGEEVEELQELLASDDDIYPEGLVTGYYGPLTKAAVERFQEQFGIERVGRVGPITRGTINKILRENGKDLESLTVGDDEDTDTEDSDDDSATSSDDGVPQFAPGDTGVKVCHVPPGNPSAQHTITVGGPAVQAHIGHGDSLGECDGDADVDDEDDNGTSTDDGADDDEDEDDDSDVLSDEEIQDNLAAVVGDNETSSTTATSSARFDFDLDDDGDVDEDDQQLVEDLADLNSDDANDVISRINDAVDNRLGTEEGDDIFDERLDVDQDGDIDNDDENAIESALENIAGL